MAPKKISVRGARVHNLKNIDVDLPRNSLVVLTGLSGSGKSSLAFDTIYAEGQRRYVESLSAYARQFLGQMEKPDVDAIEGLSPAVSIDQKTTSRNPRSTVGTVTEIHDYLRLLFARVGDPHCTGCGKKLESQSEENIYDQIAALPGDKILMSPIVDGKKGQHKKLFETLGEGGWSRVYVDGEIYRLEEIPELHPQKKHTISLVVDRLAGSDQRLRESLRTALQEGSERLEVLHEGKVLRYSRGDSCPDCRRSAPVQEPRLFSYNSPYGACPACHGLGSGLVLDPDLLIPDDTLSLKEGVLDPFSQNASRFSRALYQEVCREHQIPDDRPWKKLRKKHREILLRGDPRLYDISVPSRFGGNRYYRDVPFPGVLRALEKKYSGTSSAWKRDRIEKWMSEKTCPTCQGDRLSPEALSVEISGRNIADISKLPIDEALRWFLDLRLSEEKGEIARLLLREIEERLRFLDEVGLHYLSLHRSARTLSGGEAQRIRLATQIGSALSGVLYVLDEPSIGLHQRDNDKLLRTLENLRDLGNSVLLVEHDEATMLSADWIVDLGPGAGEEGGEVVAEGKPEKILRSPTLTGDYLSGRKKIEIPQRAKGEGEIVLRGASEHNLQDIDFSLPLGIQTCVTGVSGSGKSTLVGETLAPALRNRLSNSAHRSGSYASIDGWENLDQVIEIDQSPIGRTPRSNPATYTGTFDPIRALFASTQKSRSRGYKPGRFSFNVEGGRCEGCRGDGQIRIEMHFLPDVFVPCKECSGRRYNEETLQVLYKGLSIADVLDLSVDEALEFFKKIPKVSRRLGTLQDVGLGYLRLGQPATELSGGEAQRIKLATELARRSSGRALYILDEPTTGLHFEDVRKLLLVLRRLQERGNTILLVEHNLDTIASSDWIVDLGPGGGRDGGQIVAEGTPEDVARQKTPTGHYLQEHLRERS